MSSAGEKAKEHFENLLTFFGVNSQVEASEDGDTVQLSVQSDESGRLIGHRGETLSALQHILNSIVRRETGERVYIHVDIGGYRQARLEKLSAEAHEAAEKVAETGEEATLPGMSAGERRHIHSLLTDHEKVTTESRGEGNRRRLVVKKRD